MKGELEPLVGTPYKVQGTYRKPALDPGFVLSGKSHPKGMAPGRMQRDQRPEGVILAHTEGTWGPKRA